MMKFEIELGAASAALKRVAASVGKSSTMQVLQGVLVEAREGEVRFSATNLNTHLTISVPTEMVSVPGRVLLPHRLLLDIVRAGEGPYLAIESRPAFLAVVRVGGAEFEISGFDPDEFPRLPEFPDVGRFSMPADELQTAVKTVSYAAAQPGDARPQLTGVHFVCTPGELRLEATDSHRLAVTRVPTDGDGEGSVLIPASEIQAILDWDPEEEIVVGVTKDGLTLDDGQAFCYIRALEASYPDVQRVIPRNHSLQIGVDAETLRAAVSRALIVAKDEQLGKNHTLFVDVQPDHLLLAVQVQGTASYQEKVPISRLHGEGFRFAVNAKNLADTLKRCEGEIEIQGQGPLSPMVFVPGSDSLHLVLPIRVNGVGNNE